MPRSDRPVQTKLRCRQSPDPQGAVRKQTRYFALKLPIAVDAKIATVAYLDPGKETYTNGAQAVYFRRSRGLSM